MIIRTLYEVYDKRALHEPITGLVLMDRDRGLRRMENSARRWGGVVVRVKANILQEYPLKREVLEWKIVFVHKPKEKKPSKRDQITMKHLKGKLRKNERPLHLRR